MHPSFITILPFTLLMSHFSLSYPLRARDGGCELGCDQALKAISGLKEQIAGGSGSGEDAIKTWDTGNDKNENNNNDNNDHHEDHHEDYVPEGFESTGYPIDGCEPGTPGEHCRFHS